MYAARWCMLMQGRAHVRRTAKGQSVAAEPATFCLLCEIQCDPIYNSSVSACDMGGPASGPSIVAVFSFWYQWSWCLLSQLPAELVPCPSCTSRVGTFLLSKQQSCCLLGWLPVELVCSPSDTSRSGTSLSITSRDGTFSRIYQQSWYLLSQLPVKRV